jgi:hypothetical protein
LQGHALISEARVGLDDGGAGGHLAAVLVPADRGADLVALRGEMEAWIAAHFSAAERPRRLVFARGGEVEFKKGVLNRK